MIFCLQMQSFDAEKVQILTLSNLLILSLKIGVVCVLFKSSLLTQGDLLYYFPEDLLFYLSYVDTIILELIFVYAVR